MTETELIESFIQEVTAKTTVIENRILDFEVTKNLDILPALENDIKSLLVVAENSNLQSARLLIQAMLNVVNAAYEEDITAEAKDIDALLRACDVLAGMAIFEADELSEFLISEKVIIDDYIRNLKKIVSPHNLAKYKHLKKEKPLKKVNDKSATSAIEKFKFELVKYSIAVDNLSAKKDTSLQYEIIPAAAAAHNLKGAAQAAGLDHAAQLAKQVEETLLSASSGKLTVNDEMLETFKRSNLLLQKLADAEAYTIIDRFSEKTAEIDEFCSNLSAFLNTADSDTDLHSLILNSVNLPVKNTDYINLKETWRKIHIEEIDEMTSLSAAALEKLEEIKRSNSYFRSMKQKIRAAKIQNESILYKYSDNIGKKGTEDIHNMINMLDDIFKCSTEYEEILNESTNDASNLNRSLYSELYEHRTRPLSELTLGLSELCSGLSKYAGKKVNILFNMHGIRIGNDISPALETILPQLIRYTVLNSIENEEIRLKNGKDTESRIILSAHISGAELIITLEDDGYGVVSTENDDLAVVFNTVANYQGRFDTIVQAGKGSKIQICLPLKLKFINTLVFELSGGLYAVPASAAIAVSEIELSEIENSAYQLNKPINTKALFGLKNQTFDADEINIVCIGNEDTNVTLMFDKFICSCGIMPSQLDPGFGRINFISYGAKFENKPLLIINSDEIITHVIEQVN